jgi:glycosyltransferase involved in cell wall biosynthesis
LLITLGDGLAGLSVPSKAYSNLAAGRPLLFVGDQRSSTAALINQHGCGAALPNGESALLAETLSAWAADKPLVTAMGLRARALFEQQYDQPHAIKAYLRSLAKCCERQSVGDTLEDYARLDPVDLKDPVL